MLLTQNLFSQVFEFGWNPWSFLASNELIIQWLRLQTHMEWSPHPLHTYTRCLSSFICCGWEDWISIMLLLQSLLSHVFEFGKILGESPAPNGVMMQWLRLQTHMEWSPHPLHTYARCLTSLICCGWEDWTSIMLLPQKQNIFIRVFEFGWNCGWLPCAKWCNDWDTRPSWNGPHILFIHMRGV